MNARDKYEIEIDYYEKVCVWSNGKRVLIERWRTKEDINRAVERVIKKIEAPS